MLDNFNKLPLGIQRILIAGLIVPILMGLQNTSDTFETAFICLIFYIIGVLTLSWIVVGFTSKKDSTEGLN
jgi:hypothetical protein